MENGFIVQLGLFSNMVLAALKVAVGFLGHSPALLAEGINSTADVAYYVLVSVFMRIARKPPDHRHPHGHRQLESIGIVVVGAFVVTTAVSIFWNAMSTVVDLALNRSTFLGASQAALFVGLVTVIVKGGLMLLTNQSWRTSGSSMVKTLARDHLNDFFSAGAATLGIWMGRSGYLWVDPFAGAIVALVILKTGIDILKDGAYALMESSPSREQRKQIIELVEKIPGIEAIQSMTTRQYGPYQALNLTIGVAPNLTVQQGDDLATEAEHALKAQWDHLRFIHIHYHPFDRYAPEEII